MLAHSMIDAIADAGADAVKMQCHLADAESTPDEPWRVYPAWPQDRNRQEYWRRMEFTRDQWIDFKAHAIERGLAFIVSPFSVEAVKLTDGIADAWKVASGEMLHDELISAIIRTKKDALVSTGMATYTEIQSVANRFRGTGVKHLLMACTSVYPCPPELLGLNNLALLDRRYPVGLSDHSGTIYAGLAAVALGCDVLEVHVTLSREMQGFDTSSSITTAELRQLVEGVRFIEKAKTPVDKDAMAQELAETRSLFMGKHLRKAEHADSRP